MKSFENPDGGGVVCCEDCGILLGFIETSEYLTTALCISCARRNDQLSSKDESVIKQIKIWESQNSRGVGE